MRKKVREKREEHSPEGMEAGGIRNKNYLDRSRWKMVKGEQSLSKDTASP